MKSEINDFWWVTEVKALSPHDGSMRNYGGPNVPGKTHGEAQSYCENNGLGYCWVLGQLISEIPCIKGTHEPDWSNQVDYKELPNANKDITNFF